MNLNPFKPPSLIDHRVKRMREAKALVDHHTRRAAEMNDHMQWALAQEQHHMRMASMYASRVKTIEEQHS